MNSSQSQIVRQIEAYLSGHQLSSDQELVQYVRNNDGWLSVALIASLPGFADYPYRTMLHALLNTRSELIECSSFEPRCIRRRRQPFRAIHPHTNDRTVLVAGLPLEAKYEELFKYFQGFFPVDELTMLSSAQRFNGTVQIRFHDAQETRLFMERSRSDPIVYETNPFSRLKTSHRLTCQMLEHDHDRTRKVVNSPRPHRFVAGKAFSTRLVRSSSNASVNTSGSSLNGESTHQQSPSPALSCLNSNAYTTEQILFAQNSADTPSLQPAKYITDSKFSYDFYIPDHLVKQVFPCVVISVLNPHCFTVQLQPDAVEFDKFQRSIHTFYSDNDDSQLRVQTEQIRINLCVICASTASSDQTPIWNRSQILDFDLAERTVNVFHVDLGTWEEYVPIHRLRRLIEPFQNQMVFSLTCRLADVNPVNDPVMWSDEATQKFRAVLEQYVPQIELLCGHPNGSFEANLFVNDAGLNFSLSDYLISTKNAKPIESTLQIENNIEQTKLQFNEQNLDENKISVHPVIALYRRLAEGLQRSRSASISSSSISSAALSPRLNVKLVTIPSETNDEGVGEVSNSLLTFVRYHQVILVPNFNIYSLLQTIDPSLDADTVENYASTIGYRGVSISLESNSDLFTECTSFMDMKDTNTIILYPLDFVRYALEYYGFTKTNVCIAIENAKRAQIHGSDLTRWFRTDNELLASSTRVRAASSSNHLFNGRESSTPSFPRSSSGEIRLPFSNRLIRPM